MTGSRLDNRAIIDWLLADARHLLNSTEFLKALVERLIALGSQIDRATTGVPILHPQVYSFSALWESGKGAQERQFLADSNIVTTLATSPIGAVYRTGTTVRCRPGEPPAEGEYAILEDLRRDGIVDYLALAAPFSDGSHKALTLATRRPDGFSDTEVALFEAMMPAVGCHLEVLALRFIARSLLDTYVGRKTGGLVLDGAIRRGAGRTIRAAIWMCDLRGFTPLTETLPGDAVIDTLNDYFGAMCAAVEAEDGEVLKFIGDAMLAIFTIAGDDAGSACRRALAASRRAETAMAEINRTRSAAGKPEIEYGIALHVGEVVYGNIGGETRLDFTVIGPAVNMVSRIEGLCGSLGRRPLMSEDFVTAARIDAEKLGDFALKGLAGDRPVYSPID